MHLKQEPLLTGCLRCSLSAAFLGFICCVFYIFLPSTLILFSAREGQPLKLPETKKTLLFTFNGKEASQVLKYVYN